MNWNEPKLATLSVTISTVVNVPSPTVWLSGSTRSVNGPAAGVGVGDGVAVGVLDGVGVSNAVGVVEGVGVMDGVVVEVGVGQPSVGHGVGEVVGVFVGVSVGELVRVGEIVGEGVGGSRAVPQPWGRAGAGGPARRGA